MNKLTFMFCFCIMGPIIYDYSNRQILLSVIPLSGVYCTDLLKMSVLYLFLVINRSSSLNIILKSHNYNNNNNSIINSNNSNFGVTSLILISAQGLRRTDGINSQLATVSPPIPTATTEAHPSKPTGPPLR